MKNLEIFELNAEKYFYFLYFFQKVMRFPLEKFNNYLIIYHNALD